MLKYRIRPLRLEKGWSQEQLATIAGLSTRTVQRIENGEQASLETLTAIAAALGGAGPRSQRTAATDNRGGGA